MTDITNGNLQTILQKPGARCTWYFSSAFGFIIIKPAALTTVRIYQERRRSFLAGAYDGEKNAKKSLQVHCAEYLQHVWRADKCR